MSVLTFGEVTTMFFCFDFYIYERDKKMKTLYKLILYI